MTNKRMAEATIDASLDAYLHGANEGDIDQARHLHKLFDQMLIGKEMPTGKLWLTEHGRLLLADMHRKLSHCEGPEDQLRNEALNAVQLSPHGGQWKDNCSYVQDLRVAIAVANELCEQRKAGKHPDISAATQVVAESGEFHLDLSQISAVYDEIATTVGGFREFQAFDDDEQRVVPAC